MNKPFLFVKECQGDAKLESRSLLKEAVKEFFQSVGGTEEEILTTPLGKPYFPSGSYHLSVTHTGGLFAAVFFTSPVGIDAEKATTEGERVAKKYFSEKERELPFSQVWTAKEAVSKIDGGGLSVIKKIRVEENYAYFSGKSYRLERKMLRDTLLTLAIEEGV